MSFDKDAFLSSLDAMSVLELNELVKAIEEKFGVSAAAMAAPAVPSIFALAVLADDDEINIARSLVSQRTLNSFGRKP